MLLSLSSYCLIFVPLGTVVYFFVVVYSLYCDLKGVNSKNTSNTSERPVITVLPPGSNKFAGAPLTQPVLQPRMPSTITLPQAPLYETDIAAASSEQYDGTENYYIIPEGK
jgi:hypothetical protein